MADTQVVFLGQKGEIRQGKLKSTTQEGFMAALKKKETPSLLGKCSWKQKQKILYFFGYLDGKAGTENQHHLPSPLEGMTFYGDILVLCSASPTSYDKPSPLKTADYETFYTSNLEGDDADGSDAEGTDDDADGTDAEVDDDAGVEEEDALAGGYDDAEESVAESEEEVVEKPVRRVRKAVITAVQEEPEVEDGATWESSPHRSNIVNIIRTSFNTLPVATGLPTYSVIDDSQMIELEGIIYKKACETATYEEIRKSWNLQAFRDVYMAVARRIIGNLNPDSYIKNHNLWERFHTKELTLEEIAKQNYYELCPENWQEMVDRQAKREKIQLEGDFSRATDKWMCNGCKQRKCTYYELQTRSADEPMTIFIHCLNCGKRWTQ